MPPAGIFEDQRSKVLVTLPCDCVPTVQAGTPMAVIEEGTLSPAWRRGVFFDLQISPPEALNRRAAAPRT